MRMIKGSYYHCRNAVEIRSYNHEARGRDISHKLEPGDIDKEMDEMGHI